MWIEVDQTLRDNKDPWCKWWFLQTHYWMSIIRIWFVAYKYWLYEGSFDVINVRVNRVSTIFALASWITLRAAQGHWLIIELSATFSGKHCCDINATVSWQLVSAEHEQLLTLQLPQSKGCTAILTYNHTIGRLCRQQWLRQYHCCVLNMSVNGASSIFGLACWIIMGLCRDIDQ